MFDCRYLILRNHDVHALISNVTSFIDKLFHIKLAKVGGIKYDYIFTVLKAIMHLVELASSISGHMMIWELIRFCNVNVVSSLTHSLIPLAQ
jgi:hypothetical protein